MACSLPTYDISKLPRGYGIIIVNKFENVPALKRKGAEKEIENLKNLFISLGLKTVVYTDQTKQQIETMLDMTSKCRNLEEHSMIAIAFSSHGGRKGLYGADCDPDDANRDKFALSPNDIKSYFTSEKCPFLEGKPKLFFLNGCRGDQQEEAHFVEEIQADGTADYIDDLDFLTIHSAVHGHVAMRDKETGSLFIDVLCEVLLKYHGHEISQLIPVVNGELMKRAKRLEADTDGIQVVLSETCVAEQSLTKKLILTQVPIIQESTAGTQ